MSDQPTLGKLIDETAQRDAIHVAIAPVIAAEEMGPACRIGLLDDGTASTTATPKIGIVDPFLSSFVKKGERFYMCLYPNTVTGMRHHWHHPAFGEIKESLTDLAYHERWLREYAREMNRYDTPDDALSKLLDGLRNRRLFAHGSDLHGFYELENAAELKMHAEQYLGIKIDWSGFEFSCSC